MQVTEEYLKRSFHTKAFSWTVAQFAHDNIDPLIGDGGVFPSFREVLTYQVFGVPIEFSLLGRLGMREEEIGYQVPGNALMTGESFPVV